jgi:hypothetical protein
MFHGVGFDIQSPMRLEEKFLRDDRVRRVTSRCPPGSPGVINLKAAVFESMCAFALNLIGDCLLSELHILGKELQFEQAIPHYQDALEEIDRVQVYAFCDKVLRSMGEPGRYCDVDRDRQGRGTLIEIVSQGCSQVRCGWPRTQARSLSPVGEL